MKDASADCAANESGPRRRPEAGGYARGDEVRTRILLAAIKLFGEQGFARAATRAISLEAGVNPPALQYYFHNKERLHEACEQFIADHMVDHLRAPMAEASRVLVLGDRSAVAEALWSLVETVVDRSFDDREIPGWGPFLFRAATDATGTRLALLRRQAVDPLFDTYARLIGLAWGRSGRDPAARMAAVLLMNQVGALGFNRYDTLMRMDWSDFGDGRLRFGKDCLRAAMVSLIATDPSKRHADAQRAAASQPDRKP